MHSKHIPSRQRGQGMTEYIIIVALIAVAAIGVYSFFGQTIKGQTSSMAQELAGRSGAAEVQKAQTAADSAKGNASAQSNLGNYGGKQQ